MSHTRIIVIMHKLGVPAWLLKLTASYLSERTLVVRYKGYTSKERNMPGGGPQGTILGVVASIFQMNETRTHPPI